ncbi:MAG: hypothetical protein QOG54_44 [Actinomycetota bacterium]|jgi:V8-like Glu-specific endopeptidase|nr:hypothetical protein [Actinomycetota bacterium]
MRRVAAALSLALVAALAVMPNATAITYGEKDGTAHPSTGAFLAPVAYSDGTWVQCSGTLISPTVFLTAAHCGDGRDRVKVTFDTVYTPGRSKTYEGTYHGDPDYKGAVEHDIAVIVFDRAISGITPARLPAANSLANLSSSQQFTSVGYGGQSVTQSKGPKEIHYEDVRWRSVGTYNTVTQSALKISQNPSHGDGGTCYGDSGGPNFLGAGSGETTIVAGTTITGDTWCRSTNVTNRMDTDIARAFLGQYVTLP